MTVASLTSVIFRPDNIRVQARLDQPRRVQDAIEALSATAWLR